MKKIIISLVLSITFLNLFGRCGVSKLSIYPKTEEIHQNSIFLLEGYYEGTKIIDSLNLKFPIYLKSKDKKIPLQIIKKNIGECRMVQVLLKPQSPLEAGEKYWLSIENFNWERNRIIRDWILNKLEGILRVWKVQSKKDNNFPKWVQHPLHSNNDARQQPCGKSMFSIFRMELTDSSDILIETEVFNKSKNKSITYLLRYNRDRNVKVGKGMCVGPFMYQKGDKYKIRFSILDMSNNINLKKSDWIEIKSPMDNFIEWKY